MLISAPNSAGMILYSRIQNNEVLFANLRLFLYLCSQNQKITIMKEQQKVIFQSYRPAKTRWIYWLIDILKVTSYLVLPFVMINLCFGDIQIGGFYLREAIEIDFETIAGFFAFAAVLVSVWGASTTEVDKENGTITLRGILYVDAVTKNICDINKIIVRGKFIIGTNLFLEIQGKRLGISLQEYGELVDLLRKLNPQIEVEYK